MVELSERKYKVLIVDDSEFNRVILTEILRKTYDTVEAESGEKAIEILQRESNEISLVLLDVVMPGMDGYEVLEKMNDLGMIERIPVIMISAESSPDFITKAYDLGAVDYVSRPFESAVVQRRVKNTITLYSKQRRLADIVADQIYEKEKNSNLMLSILSHIVEFRNGESGTHVIHINIITELLLKQLMKKSNKYHLTMTDIRLISTASSLHDIGKIAIPDEILNKPGRFTPEEYEIMKTHSMEGASMLDKLPEYLDEPLINVSYEICRWHHERYDGKGYPDGLKGDEIPISAQVVSVADVYDALTSERCYKKAFSHEKAMEMICGGECGEFNPLLLECLRDISGDLETALHEKAPGIKNRLEIQNIADEILKNDDLSVSGQILQQLEFERGRSEFFENEFSDITFSYQSNPPVLILSQNAASRLGVKRIVSDPLGDPDICRMSGESLTRLIDEVSQSLPSEPDVCVNGHIIIGGEKIECQYRCRTIWMPAENPVYVGTVGLISENVHKEDE